MSRFSLSISFVALLLVIGFGSPWMVASAVAAAEEANATPLAFDPDLAICTAIVFVALLAILWKFAWGPISAGLDKREQSIAGNIE